MYNLDVPKVGDNKVLVTSQKFGSHNTIRYKELLTTKEDFARILRSVISKKNVWFDNIQVIENGHVVEWAHNRRADILASLLYDPMDDLVDWGEASWPLS